MLKNKCPSCRISVPSRRSLFRDHNYDKIIEAIYPDLDAFEESEEKYIAEINRKRNVNNAFTAAATQGIKEQHEERKKRKRQKKDGGTASVQARTTSRRSGGVRGREPLSGDNQASFILLKHPDEVLPGLDGGSFLTSSDKLSVSYMQKYIR